MKSLGKLACFVVPLLAASLGGARAMAAEPTIAFVDPFAARARVLVMTDIANEPDDQMSMVRFLLYSNQFDVEGLVASTSTWMKTKVRPDVILAVLEAYEKVQPNLAKHAPGFPTAAALRRVVTSGQPSYGMAAVGPDKTSPGAELILRAALASDPRPLWIVAWGGTNTLAQALLEAKATRTPSELEAIVGKLRVYAISDQDDAGPWIRREFPGLSYVATPSTQNGEEYYFATWTGISGDRFYRNAPGADFTTFTDEWVNANIRSKEPLGKLYPFPCCIHEGDTPSFLGLIDNGLASAMSPAYGGWGGRYVWRKPSGETRPFWTQGGDSYPGNDSSRDTVVGIDGKPYTSDQATIWRWRTAFQHDFAARMDWTTKAVSEANHNPRVVVNGRPGTEPLVVEAQVDAPVILDASGTTDPDGQALAFTWFFYAEAGTGIPGQPVLVRRRFPAAPAGEGGIPPAPPFGPRELPPRVVIANANTSRATIIPEGCGYRPRHPGRRGRRRAEPDLLSTRDPRDQAPHARHRRVAGSRWGPSSWHELSRCHKLHPSMLRRLRERQEWKFFAVLPRADRGLAVAWWAVLLLRGVLPAVFASPWARSSAAVQRGARASRRPLAVVGRGLRAPAGADARSTRRSAPTSAAASRPGSTTG